MRRFWRFAVLLLLFLPLTISAETLTWNAATTFSDGTNIPTSEMSKMAFYLRLWNEKNPSGKVYFGETRNGITTWTDNVMVRANQRITPPLVPGDNVFVTVSQAYLSPVDNVERDSVESNSVRWTIPGATTPPLPPAILTFVATPSSITSGQCSTLSWTVSNATILSINNGIGTVIGANKSVCPTTTTIYTLTATGAGGTKTATAGVTVTPAIPPPGCNPPTGLTIRQ